MRLPYTSINVLEISQILHKDLFVLRRISSIRGSFYPFFLCRADWIVNFCKRHYLKFFKSDLHINEEKWVALYVVIVLSKMCFVLFLHINYKKKANLYVNLILWWMRFSFELHIRYGKIEDLYVCLIFEWVNLSNKLHITNKKLWI